MFCISSDLFLTFVLFDIRNYHFDIFLKNVTQTCERIQVSMLAPTMYPATSKLMRMNLPWRKRRVDFMFQVVCELRTNEYIETSLTNLEELSFLTVFALPKASRMGLACSSCLSSSPWDTQEISDQLHNTTEIRAATRTSIGSIH